MMVNRIFWGLVLIVIGILFILDQRQIIAFDLGEIVSTYWPLILIYFGLKGLIFQYKWGQGLGFGYLWPLILTIFGVYFLGHNIDYIQMSASDFFQYIIPFLLIVIGVLIVLKPSRSKEESSNVDGHSEDVSATDRQRDREPYVEKSGPTSSYTHAETKEPHDQPEEARQEPSGLVLREPVKHDDTKSQDSASFDERPENHFSFIGDIHIGSANWRLKPLNVNHFIGDTIIDLTRATIPEGLTKINVGCMIGDVKILLPKDEDVEPSVTMTSIMGEFNMFGKRDDSMFKNRREESAHYPTAKKKLQIMANVLIGDLRIERV